jgi:hypothetical protein
MKEGCEAEVGDKGLVGLGIEAGGDMSFIVIASSDPFDCAGLLKGDLDGVPFSGLIPADRSLTIYRHNVHRLPAFVVYGFFSRFIHCGL